MWPAVKAMLRSVYDQLHAAVNAQFDRFLDYVSEKLPAVAEHLDTARADVLALTAFPGGLWQHIWSNSPNERLNREIRRRYFGLDILARCQPNTTTGEATASSLPSLTASPPSEGSLHHYPGRDRRSTIVVCVPLRFCSILPAVLSKRLSTFVDS